MVRSASHMFAQVSGLATHENRLRSPDQWWPQLWSKYSELQKAEVLGGLLWQLAPSHRCSRQSLYELEELAKRLPRNVLHIFEFRHSSWYGAHRDDVVNLLRRWGLCLAWIHIQNSDGWCGDLEDGWPSLARTCNSAYLRLFGTKQKAIGRYGEEMIRETILPMVQGPGAPTDSFVVFAQADVPDHAKADAAFMVELLGRTDSQPGRSARWERDVLVATLGLGVGMQVTGVVQRITHRTVFVDIGRSCRAFLDANHARRAGLLESLRIGTHVEGLEVQHLDFQGEWGIVGLSCHKAFVSLGAAEEEARASAPAEVEIEEPNQAAKRSRWLRQGTGESSDAFCSEAGASPAAVAVAALAEETENAPRLRQRWAHRTFEGLAEIGKTSGSRHVVQTPVEELEEQARVKRMAARAKRDERTSRWARALVEKAIDQQQIAEAKKKIESKVASQRTSAKRSRSEGPAPRTRREVALAERSRAETKKAQEETMSRAERRKGAGKESDEVPGDWTPNVWSSGQVLPGEPGNGPMAVSTDEFLLMQLEQREGEETQCDEKNFETFGEVSYQQGDWNAEQMFLNERVVTRRRVWRAGALPSPLEPGAIKAGRNMMGYSHPDDEAADAENAEQAESVAEEAVILANVPDEDSREVAAEERTEDDEEDWQVLQSTREELEEAWEDELEHEACLHLADHPALPSMNAKAPPTSFQAWVPRLRVNSSSSWADATDDIQDSDVAEALRDGRNACKGNDDILEEAGQAVETVQEAIGQEDQPCLEPHLLDDEEEGVEEDRTGSAPASAPQKSHSEHGPTKGVTDKDGLLRRGWRGRSKKEILSASLEDSRPEAADDSSEDETILATQLLAEAEAFDANPDRARHTARCVLCGMAYSLSRQHLLPARCPLKTNLAEAVLTKRLVAELAMAAVQGFEHRKRTFLAKCDKSSAGEIDAKAREVCAELNLRPAFFTTSSCAGRAFIWRGDGVKSTECFSRWRVTHDLVEDANAYFDLSTLEELGGVLPGTSERSVCGCFAALSRLWRSEPLGQGRRHQQAQRAELAEAKLSEAEACYWLRFEPFILHVCCRDLVAAAALMAAARSVFKNVGLQGLQGWGDSKEAKLIVAIWGDEGLDMPLTGPTALPLFRGQQEWLQSLVNSRHLRNWQKIDRFTEALRQMQEQ
eukprot:s5806_g3.t2